MFDQVVGKLMLELSRLAYLEEAAARSGIEALALRDLTLFDEVGTQAMACVDDDRAILAFRGTDPDPRDWITDGRFTPIRGELGGRVHSGFHAALNAVWPTMGGLAAAAGDRTVWVTGHSLGAALATLAAARIVEDGGEVAGVYIYGGPRTGLGDFRDAYNDKLKDVTFRVVNHIDLVTRVPLLIQGYRHVGRMVYFDQGGKMHVDASPWHVARDDLRYRLTHWGRIEAIGTAPHMIGPYRRLFA